MYLITATATDATSTTTRFRMPVLRAEWVSGMSVADGHVASAAAFGYGVGTQAPFKGAGEGVRAWSPPV